MRVLAIGAHPDDIEIGAGGTLLTLDAGAPEVRYVVMTGSPERQLEARQAAGAFLPSAAVTTELHDLPEGRLPPAWAGVKDALESVARSYLPDLILAPSAKDAHQDHRTFGEIVPTAFGILSTWRTRIPKWDGDLGRPSTYVPLSAEAAKRKVELLHKSYPSQQGRDWWDEEVFLGLARLRGMECRAPYAEAFTNTKTLLLTSS